MKDAAAQLPPKPAVVSLAELLAEQPAAPPPGWIEPGLLPPQGILFVGGEPKVGKSLLVANLALALAAGKDRSGFTIPELAQLLRRQDVPRPPRRLPRALTAQQDQLLQQELLRRNDLGANVLLLLRHTGMRIGEAADLSFDCLHASGTDRWTIHVPLGKLKTERMVPVDSFVCQLVRRLRFFRSFDLLPPDDRLLARPSTREALIRHLRRYLHAVCTEAGIAKRIVPHQLRHTYASEMLRSGVEFLSSMKLLGHASP